MTTTLNILGFDYEISLSYLREGDEFLAYDPQTRFFRHGVADMDGNQVSEYYGFRGSNSYVNHPDRNYINVKWSDLEYVWPNTNGAEFQTLVGDNMYTGPNSTVYERDGLMIMVKAPVHARVQLDEQENARAQRRNDKALAESELRDAVVALEAAQVAVRKAQVAVRKASAKARSLA